MRWLLFILFGSFSLLSVGQTTRIFISAHQDDWQLFMNPNVAESIRKTEDRTVIIHTTAGDAGHGMGNDSYYLAREKGSLRAMRFLVNSNPEKSEWGQDTTITHPHFNGHPIRAHEYRNTVMYFLRLPDGNGDGSGFALHQNKSLECFYKSNCASMTTIDGSTSYSSIEDLEATLEEIIRKEQKNNSLEIHLADTDATINPNDHSDHQTSSKIIQDVLPKLGKAKLYLYTNYATALQPNNTDQQGFLISAATWGATTSGISDYRHYSTWDNVHNAWIGKQYYRVKNIKP